MPILLNKAPSLQGCHVETRSILDLHYWKEANMLFLVNATLGNFIQKSGLFSFGKKKEPVQTPGSVAGYCQSIGDDTNADYGFKQQWWMNYPSPSTRAAWSSKLELLVCGEDSGMMHFLKPYSTNTAKCDELFVIKVHSERMTAIAIDEDRKLVYSVSEDRKFKVVDIEKKRVSSEFEISSKKVNCMHVDIVNRVAYVGDSEGNVKVVDLSKNPPTCANNIKITTKDSVVAVCLVKNQLYSACADTGKVFIHSLSDPSSAVTPLL